jgi:hypothetical protein
MRPRLEAGGLDSIWHCQYRLSQAGLTQSSKRIYSASPWNGLAPIRPCPQSTSMSRPQLENRTEVTVGLSLYDELQAWHLFLQCKSPQDSQSVGGIIPLLVLVQCLVALAVSFGDRHPLPGLT